MDENEISVSSQTIIIKQAQQCKINIFKKIKRNAYKNITRGMDFIEP